MWHARTKDELIIEVWEKLDCESVGAAEIEAIETAVAAEYGQAAVDSPMIIARLLADEGAELRHPEIMRLFVERASDRPYDAAFRNLMDTESLRGALRSIRELNNLRQKYAADNDRRASPATVVCRSGVDDACSGTPKLYWRDPSNSSSLYTQASSANSSSLAPWPSSTPPTPVAR